MSGALTPLVLNNMIVERLRSGSADAVRSLKDFGVRPHMVIDDVDLRQGTQVQRRSAWYWAHQAKIADGVEVMWGMLDNQLRGLDDAARMGVLSERLEEACLAGLPRAEVAALELTWGRTAGWARECGWSRPFMMAYLTRAACQLGDDAVPGLRSLSDGGCLTRPDWDFSARQTYGSDPLTHAIEKDCQHLTMLMLDLGCDPVTQDGTPILTVAWSRLREEIKKTDIHVDGMASAFTVVDALLNRDINWRVPAQVGNTRTVAEDAATLVTFLSSKPHWRHMAHQIERRMLDENTPQGTAGPARRARRI